MEGLLRYSKLISNIDYDEDACCDECFGDHPVNQRPTSAVFVFKLRKDSLLFIFA